MMVQLENEGKGKDTKFYWTGVALSQMSKCKMFFKFLKFWKWFSNPINSLEGLKNPENPGKKKSGLKKDNDLDNIAKGPLGVI